MACRTVDVAVIIPDASPVLTLARIGRLDLFETFSTPIHIVDQVHYEITKPASDLDGKVTGWLQRMGNRVVIEETLVGLGFRTKLERGETPSGRNLGEIAVDEYATQLALRGSPTFIGRWPTKGSSPTARCFSKRSMRKENRRSNRSNAPAGRRAYGRVG